MGFVKNSKVMRLDTKTWVLIPLAVALNVVVGGAVGAIKIPLCLDSVGTILVACLSGPWAGMLTGIVSNVISSMMSPVWLRYMPVAIVIGLVAGIFAKKGLMRGTWLAALAGAVVGVICSVVAAPITAFFGGVSGSGMDALVAAFRAAGLNTFEACFAQELLTGPLDKAICFVLVQIVLATLPQRIRCGFLQGEALAEIRTIRIPFLGPKPVHGNHGVRREVSVAGLAPEFYQPGDSFFHRATPGTKLLLVICSLAGALFFPAWMTVNVNGVNHIMPLPYYPLLLAGLLALGVGVGVGLRMSKMLLYTALPIDIALILVNGLFSEAGRDLGFLGLKWATNDAMNGAGIAMGITLFIESVALLLLTTPSSAIFNYLERNGMPARLNYVFMASINLIPIMAHRFGEIHEAQTARALPTNCGFFSRMRAFLPMFFPLLMSAIAEVEERSLALEARGFRSNANRTWWAKIPRPAYDSDLQVLIMLIFFAVGVRVYL